MAGKQSQSLRLCLKKQRRVIPQSEKQSQSRSASAEWGERARDTTNGSGAQTGSQAPRFEVTQYAIAAQLYPSTHMLKAKARIEFVPKADVTSLFFDLHSALRVEKVADAAGQSLRFKQEGLTLAVDLLNPASQGKPSSITVDYGGPLASAGGSPVEGLKLAYVGPEGAYLLYPGRWFSVNAYGVNRFAAAGPVTLPSDEIVIASGQAAAPER